ncbi:S9 family peptidase [Erythrobacter sanguineus]|uniref:Dipeptidyl aminopeptidase/acylaminoacyl peptidase n=1 Tax=Erythrobacter sanguineus TaxID=198312 RepID=A0A1M7RVY1_9SPHN|nr:S9 family peptidase [Erythrobacter sanguineus]SHN50152.1 Dipeptidyl aminopeptidase/acylaminoacyl peptidase [Erythrobacter sanguineus]
MIRSVFLASAAAIFALPQASIAQDAEETFGGAKGADLSIAAIEPDGGAITIGRAGEYPADIARYLLASGAGAANLSPDGKTIAFAWDVTGESELWVMPASGGQPQQVTFKTGVFAPVWTPDGTRLFYSADRDGNEQPGYFAITADGKSETEVLAAARGDFRIFGDFAADGSFVYASTARGAGVFDIYRGTLDGQSELIVQSELGLAARSISPDGKFAIVTETVGEDADNLYLLDLATRAMTTISRPPVEDRAAHTLGGFEWAPDSSGFYFSTNRDREFGTLAFYSLAKASFAPVFDAKSDVENLELCGTGGDFLYWTQNDDGFDTLRGWHTADKRAIAMPQLPEGRYQLDCEADGQLMVRVNGWQTPGEIWMTNPVAGTAQKVFAANLAGLDPARLVRPEVVRYKARDGVELQGLLYLPAGAGTGADAPPVLFNVHGGPSGQSVASFSAVTQYHVARGVAVFQPNVRGSTGLGRTYSTLDDRERRLDSVRDLVDLKRALAADGLIDGSRAAVMGGSYGGYAVNAVLAEYPGEFAAGISLFGVADWVTALEIASPSLKAADKIEYGDIAEDKWREFYKVNSPIRKADRITVPVLYSHGVMDPRIDIAETETMVKTLRANGVAAPFIRIPDEGHGWRKLSNQLFYYRKQAEFIEEQLGLTQPE